MRIQILMLGLKGLIKLSLADIHQSSCHPSSYVFAVLAIFLGSSSTNSSSQKGGNVPPLQ